MQWATTRMLPLSNRIWTRSSSSRTSQIKTLPLMYTRVSRRSRPLRVRQRKSSKPCLKNSEHTLAEKILKSQLVPLTLANLWISRTHQQQMLMMSRKRFSSSQPAAMHAAAKVTLKCAFQASHSSRRSSLWHSHASFVDIVIQKSSTEEVCQTTLPRLPSM